MNANHRPTAANSQCKIEFIDESFFDNHAGYLLSEGLNQGGIDAIESFMTMCNHLGNVFNLKLNISDISQNTVMAFMMYLTESPNMSIAEINLQLEELREFIGWTMDNEIPTQDLVIPRVFGF